MADWTTISALATAGGTLVLAVATFSSVRSANRAARTAERAYLARLRPVLFPSRPEDPDQKIRWGDGHWAHVPGGRALVEPVDGVVYFAASLRNVGSGIAVLRAWEVRRNTQNSGPVAPDPSTFRSQERDLYVPVGDVSFWQAAIRDRDHPGRSDVEAAIADRQPLAVDILYGDHEGGQRTISRFSLFPVDDGPSWICAVVRHWNIDRDEPR
jgi:hypothetical protein